MKRTYGSCDACVAWSIKAMFELYSVVWLSCGLQALRWKPTCTGLHWNTTAWRPLGRDVLCSVMPSISVYHWCHLAIALGGNVLGASFFTTALSFPDVICLDFSHVWLTRFDLSVKVDVGRSSTGCLLKHNKVQHTNRLHGCSRLKVVLS